LPISCFDKSQTRKKRKTKATGKTEKMSIDEDTTDDGYSE
jgi:hypothetical protein